MRLALLGGAGATGMGIYSLADNRAESPVFMEKVPSREEQVEALKKGTAENPYDMLIIGGGATGTGCAVDAATRCAQ